MGSLTLCRQHRKISSNHEVFCATKVQFFSQLKWFLISQFGGPKISTTTRAAVGIMASKIRVLLRSSLSGERGYWFSCGRTPRLGVAVMGMWRIRVYQRGMIQVQRGFIDSWPYIYIINPCCNFLSRIEGAGKNLRFWRALLHPYFATKSKTMGWQAPKNNPFLTFLDCILAGSWFCKWGPQQSAESVQNLTFWSWNWFCRNKAGDTLRSLIF